jgi:hypothetical protein
MRAFEILSKAKQSIRGQILNDILKHGGNTDQYFVRFTDVDKLGFSAKQTFGKTLDVDDPDFYPEYIGAGKGKPALWFYPLQTYLKNSDLYAGEYPYVWLIKLKNNAWLQKVTSSTKELQNAPAGKERVGILRMIKPWPAAIFFKPAFEVVGKYTDFKKLHKQHGLIKGKPTPTLFQKIRGDL